MNEVMVVNPADQMVQAQQAASVSKEIVTRTSVPIQGKRHVAIEGWQAVAVANGCTLGSRDVKRVEGGYTAVGELRRISDGTVLATAEGFVGDDESTWRDKPEHARRAMAQTRAMSRVGRSAFAHIVVMMGADLCTTPAEEMDGVIVNKAPSHAEQPAFSGSVQPPAKMSATNAEGKLDFTVMFKELGTIKDPNALNDYHKAIYAAHPKMSEKQKAAIEKSIAKRKGEIGDIIPAGEMYGDN